MVDSNVQYLLEQAINSRTKLHILLLFYENPRMEMTATLLVQRCCRDIWSITRALQELARDGILLISQCTGGEPVYSYAPRREYLEPVSNLMQSYDDPIKRESLYRSIREISEYAMFPQPPHVGQGSISL